MESSIDLKVISLKRKTLKEQKTIDFDSLTPGGAKYMLKVTGGNSGKKNMKRGQTLQMGNLHEFLKEVDQDEHT